MPVFSDRTKRRAILGTSALLPRAARVALRRAGLERLERSRAERARIFIVGHPKSGNTWVRTMISRAYQVKYGLPSTLILKSDELNRADARAPRFCVSNGHYSYEAVVGRILDADAPDPAFRDRKVVFLARHPADVAVSWYIQFTKRISQAKRELINAELARPIDPGRVSRWDFVMKSEIGLPSLIDFMNRWERNVRARGELGLIVRYEDLRRDTLPTLLRISRFFELDLSEQELATAVEWASFDNLKRLEASGHFARGGLKNRTPDDPDSYKVRRGKIFGYRNDFDPEQLATVEALVAEKLSPTLGYTEVAGA